MPLFVYLGYMRSLRLVFTAFVVWLIVTALSCNEPTSPSAFDGIYGTVRDATTDFGLGEARVYLYESDNEGGWGGGSPYYVIDSMIANANGEFAFEFENTQGHSYSLFATKDQYIVGNTLTFVQYGNEKDVLLDPIAYIEFHAKNIDPASESDQLAVNGPLSPNLYGAEIDTTILELVHGNAEHVIYWSINHGPTATDTIFCPAFDTTYYELLY